MTKKTFLLITLLASVLYCNAQKKNKESNANYTYIVDGKDSIKCKRIPMEALKSTYESAFIPNLQSNLDKYKECLTSSTTITNCDYFERQVKQYIDWAKNQKIETEDFSNELNYYIKLNEKKITENKLAIKKDNQIKDSINTFNVKQRKLNDSIAEVNRQENIEKQKEQNVIQEKLQTEQDKKNKIDYAEKQKQRRIKLIEKYGETDGELIFKGKVRIGMSKEMCIEAWGKPSQINRTTNAYGTHEQWVYNLKSYLYFDSDALTTIQN